MLYSTTPVCTTCDHQRCSHCSVYGVPVTGGGGGGTNAPAPTTARDGSSRKGTSIATPKAAQEVDSRKETGEPTTTGARRGGRDAYVETTGKSNPTAGQISKTESPEQRESPQGRDLMRDLLDVKGSPKRHDKPLDKFDIDAADTETVLSTVSSATTLVDPGAVEAFASNVMSFRSLVCLWPQLVGRCETRERSVHIIERLIKRYSEDLALESHRTQASKNSGNQLYLTAARFVRKSRFQVAHKIWEAQIQDVNNKAGKSPMGCLLDVEVPNLVDENDDAPADDDVLFETIEEILFDKSPIFSLQANIKSLINLSNPMENSTVYRLSTSFNIFIQNAVSSLREPSLSPGYTRMRYTCVSLANFIFYRFLLFLKRHSRCS